MIDARDRAPRFACCALALLGLLSLRPAVAESSSPEELARTGSQVVWLDFWASWCTPCRHSFPWMNAMQRRYGSKGFKVLAVNLDAERKDADRFLATTPAEFLLEFDPQGTLAKRYDVEAMPSSYLLDRGGRVVSSHLGFKESKEVEYEAAIRAALGLQEK
jgi:thiol-disulfide isomerase/thioredoxin